MIKADLKMKVYKKYHKKCLDYFNEFLEIINYYIKNDWLFTISRNHSERTILYKIRDYNIDGLFEQCMAQIDRNIISISSKILHFLDENQNYNPRTIASVFVYYFLNPFGVSLEFTTCITETSTPTIRKHLKAVQKFLAQYNHAYIPLTHPYLREYRGFRRDSIE